MKAGILFLMELICKHTTRMQTVNEKNGLLKKSRESSPVINFDKHILSFSTIMCNVFLKSRVKASNVTTTVVPPNIIHLCIFTKIITFLQIATCIYSGVASSYLGSDITFLWMRHQFSDLTVGSTQISFTPFCVFEHSCVRVKRVVLTPNRPRVMSLCFT